MNRQHDICIIGAGLGGLLCGAILAREGFDVLVLDQNKQIGGCLQVFGFEKKIFDSCVHYIGGMDKGQNLERILNYAGVMDQLHLQRLDAQGFDRIVLGDDPAEIPLAEGYEAFVDNLAQHFPHQRQALQSYCDALADTCRSFPLYNLRLGDTSEKERVSGNELWQTVQQYITDPKLQQVLCGNHLLYAGVPGVTPFYLHALTLNSYIESSWKFKQGSHELPQALKKQIRAYGGQVLAGHKVTALHTAGGVVTSVACENGEQYTAKQFIGAIHPNELFNMVETGIRPSTRQRVASLEQGLSGFMVQAVLEPGTIPHRNHNLYWHQHDVWNVMRDPVKHFGESYALYFTEDPARPGYSDTVSVLTYMDKVETDRWAPTFNATIRPAERCADYGAFKEEKATQLLDKVALRYPAEVQHIRNYKVASPLTFRDYMGTADGSMYGILKDVRNPAMTAISTHTRIPNLFLTGQNINLHGVLGVSMTALLTVGDMIGLPHLLNKINQQ